MVREAHLKLAQMHEALGQDEEAAAHYRQCALASDPLKPTFAGRRLLRCTRIMQCSL